MIEAQFADSEFDGNARSQWTAASFDVMMFACAIGWLALIAVERVGPDALPFQGRAGTTIAAALVLSLIVSAGFVHATCRFGRFYIKMRQPALAGWVCRYVLRLGSFVAVAAAALGIGVARYAGVPFWPYVVLGADEFIVLSVLWMGCAAVSVGRGAWAAAIPVIAGSAVFAACRMTGQDVLLAQLVASASALACMLVEVQWAFASGDNEEHRLIPIPRMTVLMYRALPSVLYGGLVLLLLCVGRLHAVAARPASDYEQGMNLALVTFLMASAGVGYVHRRFAGRLRRCCARSGSAAELARLGRAAGHLVLGSVAILAVGYVAIALATGAAAKMLLGPASDTSWSVAVFAGCAYLLTAIGLLNARVLIGLDRSWAGACAVFTGVVVTTASSLIAGAAAFAVISTLAVHTRLRQSDFLIAAI
jgi:hypothetical protein